MLPASVGVLTLEEIDESEYFPKINVETESKQLKSKLKSKRSKINKGDADEGGELHGKCDGKADKSKEEDEKKEMKKKKKRKEKEKKKKEKEKKKKKDHELNDDTDKEQENADTSAGKYSISTLNDFIT